MDIGQIIHSIAGARRADEMLNSEQLTLGELILKLEAVKDKTKPVVFDEKPYVPTGLGSWRGSYREMTICYEGSDSCYDLPEPSCQKDSYGGGYHDYKCPCGGRPEHSTDLGKDPTVQKLLDALNLAKGRFFVGYKGGDFTMGKSTPLWVANYGASSGFKTNEDGDSVAVIGLLETEKEVVLQTKLMKY